MRPASEQLPEHPIYEHPGTPEGSAIDVVIPRDVEVYNNEDGTINAELLLNDLRGYQSTLEEVRSRFITTEDNTPGVGNTPEAGRLRRLPSEEQRQMIFAGVDRYLTLERMRREHNIPLADNGDEEDQNATDLSELRHSYMMRFGPLMMSGRELAERLNEVDSDNLNTLSEGQPLNEEQQFVANATAAIVARRASGRDSRAYRTPSEDIRGQESPDSIRQRLTNNLSELRRRYFNDPTQFLLEAPTDQADTRGGERTERNSENPPVTTQPILEVLFPSEKPAENTAADAPKRAAPSTGAEEIAKIGRGLTGMFSGLSEMLEKAEAGPETFHTSYATPEGAVYTTLNVNNYPSQQTSYSEQNSGDPEFAVDFPTSITNLPTPRSERVYYVLGSDYEPENQVVLVIEAGCAAFYDTNGTRAATTYDNVRMTTTNSKGEKVVPTNAHTRTVRFTVGPNDEQSFTINKKLIRAALESPVVDE